MRVFYICDCCDQVFDVVNQDRKEAGKNLTNTKEYAIISRGLDNDDNYVYSICPNCKEDIESGFTASFYKKQLLN